MRRGRRGDNGGGCGCGGRAQHGCAGLRALNTCFIKKVVMDIDALLKMIATNAYYGIYLDSHMLSTAEFAILQKAVIARGTTDMLIAFARNNPTRADIARIEQRCWKLWDSPKCQDKSKNTHPREKIKLGALVPGVDIRRLENDILENYGHLADIVIFADEVPGADVNRLEEFLFAISEEKYYFVPYLLAEFVVINGADVARIEKEIIASTDLLAMCSLLTGSYNMQYRKAKGINAKAVLDAIRTCIQKGNYTKMHPADMIACYETAKSLANTYGYPPIVNLEMVQHALATDDKREEANLKRKALWRMSIVAESTTLQ